MDVFSVPNMLEKDHVLTILRIQNWTNEIAQRVKELSIKSDDLCLISGAHIWEGENKLLQDAF